MIDYRVASRRREFAPSVPAIRQRVVYDGRQNDNTKIVYFTARGRAPTVNIVIDVRSDDWVPHNTGNTVVTLAARVQGDSEKIVVRLARPPRSPRTPTMCIHSAISYRRRRRRSDSTNRLNCVTRISYTLFRVHVIT